MLDFPTPAEALDRFFEFFWRGQDGWVYTPVIKDLGTSYATVDPLMFHWPAGRASVVKHLMLNAAKPDLNCFFSPAMFARASAKKEAVLGSHVLWADYDGNAPEWPNLAEDGSVVVPRPDLVVESSGPGHQHTYWDIGEFVTDVDWLDEKNRAIALATGADSSGWDANQLLRPPHTLNRKYDPARPVRIEFWG